MLVKKGINATLYTQAANSPDVDILDLGFLRAIQSFNNAAPKNEEELIKRLVWHMISIPATRSIRHGLPYSVSLTR